MHEDNDQEIIIEKVDPEKYPDGKTGAPLSATMVFPVTNPQTGITAISYKSRDQPDVYFHNNGYSASESKTLPEPFVDAENGVKPPPYD